jgi:hypothetical protein
MLSVIIRNILGAANLKEERIEKFRFFVKRML